MGEWGKVVWEVETASNPDKLKTKLNEFTAMGYTIYTVLDSSDEGNLFYTIIATHVEPI